MPQTKPPEVRFRRRNFFVKQGFQLRFALYPIGFFGLFLVVAGFYLHTRLRDTLEFHLYMPHSRLQNPWEVVGPPVLQVVAVGAAAFVAALSVWAWRRFARLRTDLDALSLWFAPLAQGGALRALPRIGDPEVQALGEGLEKAVTTFGGWDREVRQRIEALAEALGDLKEGEVAGEGFATLRERLRALNHVLLAIRVEEDLG